MDTIETIHEALVQHGPHNDRIYLKRLNDADPYRLITILEELARQKGYGKIFVKTPAPTWPTFRSADYIKEAEVPGFYNGRTDGFFIAKYLSDERRPIPASEMRLERSGPRGMDSAAPLHRPGQSSRAVTACRSMDAEEISRIYRQVFKTYPFPVHRQSYLKRMMREEARYYGIRIEGRIAAVAAAAIDRLDQNVEMTDFATLPKWRGRGLAGSLRRHMDKTAQTLGIKTAYTIARAVSPGMNAVFRQNGYRFAGLLRNNTQISGKIESMTVWYMRLQDHAE